jgi:hypothetical protein
MAGLRLLRHADAALVRFDLVGIQNRGQASFEFLLRIEILGRCRIVQLLADVLNRSDHCCRLFTREMQLPADVVERADVKRRRAARHHAAFAARGR